MSIIKRRRTRVIRIGTVSIGGRNPVAIQSMVKYKTSEVDSVVRQIRKLQRCGCEIGRLAIKDSADAEAIKRIKQQVSVPLVADIHFSWRLALEAIENGVDKIRLNPGNISHQVHVRQVVQAAKSRHIHIRIGLNSGSLPAIRTKAKTPAERMVTAALDYIKLLERFGFFDIVVSLKASNIQDRKSVV